MSVRRFEDHQPAIHAGVYIDEQALVVGEVSIGTDSSVWPMSVVPAIMKDPRDQPH